MRHRLPGERIGSTVPKGHYVQERSYESSANQPYDERGRPAFDLALERMLGMPDGPDRNALRKEVLTLLGRDH